MSDYVQMTETRAYEIGANQIPTFWDVLWSAAYMNRSRPIYGRHKGEMRGFAPGGADIPVPRWIALRLWLKATLSRRSATMLGQATRLKADKEKGK